MPRTDAEREKRKAFYREGRLLGMSPRDAGHLYSAKAVARAAERIAKADHRVRGKSAEARQAKYADHLSKDRGVPVSVAESRYRYTYHNRAKVETKVRVTLRTSEGLVRRTFTILDDAKPTRGRLRDAVGTWVDRGNSTGSDPAQLVGFSTTSQVVYPSVVY
jgi:hypothetical protein